MVNLIINPVSKKFKKINCDTTPNTRLSAIIEAYAKKNNVSDPNRIKFSYIPDDEKSKKKITLKNYLTLEENGLDFKQNKEETLHVYAKDVGPQIGWRTVYFIEYLGPMIIHSLFYYLYYDAGKMNYTQILSYNLTLLHYLKREYETLFIHTFSADTMPLSFLFRNSGHYWIINGLFIAFSIYAPSDSYYDVSTTSGQIWKFIHHIEDRSLDELKWFGGAMVIFEICNLYCHILLRRLRSDGSREHKIPYGFAFKFVSFPNYFFEFLSWTVFALMTNNWSSYFFLIVGTGTMMMWAKQKHAKYKKTFGDKYPKNRKAMIPFIF
ncbi:3-oxo-5a-steroid 4- dehydrogenase [Pichia californica]|uniref:3-oxo-5a-steroid 4- dehydrogenase n=1 Tax=Pichia californica TaxID=460514 RepID=A0A9P7BGJ4_9ASCO|nr:3-oxo-5a-steroid 4- dehydrogenase [[Candida] californica]KAG0689270.1 3-oxo-5a-steroid 4- dehydrogenase [[Candida] californica]